MLSLQGLIHFAQKPHQIWINAEINNNDIAENKVQKIVIEFKSPNPNKHLQKYTIFIIFQLLYHACLLYFANFLYVNLIILRSTSKTNLAQEL